jgi:hypothetical protein
MPRFARPSSHGSGLVSRARAVAAFTGELAKRRPERGPAQDERQAGFCDPQSSRGAVVARRSRQPASCAACPATP